MDTSEAGSVVLGVVGTATAVLLALTDQYAAGLAAVSAYAAAWWLLREPAERTT